MYRLTLPEIERLMTGFEVWEQQREQKVEDAAGGSSTSTRHPNRTARGEIRDADRRAVEQFADDQNLDLATTPATR